ncbi:alcohol dehydrogenase catalytic domain-containing protein [Sphingobium sp. 3R8]|uniref:alcohol dehydrogenase catalytic domain-containing protein n=1 Tax=Sphingobium sp. 3R8 TaxID=2874921 RepID=UPI001CCF07F6|nr:alcohol dehydrogenase catalytic domain-containing protein [Sphingobium sp. 3R8]MBZ9646871.1 alcohol dehydrogenase catalytic domain-containing protein [Sphingobium sp. 3R8]
MRALIIRGTDLQYEQVPDPVIMADRDAIVRVKQCGICGSDLHLVHTDWTPFRPVYGVGHEAVGEVVDVGKGVSDLKVGDKVMLAGSVGCGLCRPCLSGEIKRCDNKASDVYGIGQGLEGCQAEAVRVPHADFNATRIPEGISDDQAILLTDNLVTAYSACLDADIGAGRSAAVIGLGPIGLMVVEIAIAMGASTVFAIDPIAERREIATRLGCVALTPEGASEILAEQTKGRMIDSVIEAVGRQETIDFAMAIVGKGRTVSVLGAGRHLEVKVPFSAMLNGVTVRANMLTEIARFWPQLVPLVQSGRIRPEQFITHRFPLSKGVEAYDLAIRREAGLLKIMLQP